MTSLPAQDLIAPSPTGEPKTIFDYLEDPAAIAALPSMKSVLSELESLTQNGNIRLDEVAQMVQMDQGMSLRVLRMANSVYYAPSRPITDVHEAILYIGMGGFRSVLLSTRCIETTSHIKQSTLDWKDFWIHAAGVGHLNRELASHLKKKELEPESYYLMGLWHDIGKVFLAHVMPDEFDKIYEQAALEKKSPAQMEMEILGVDHGYLGACYLEKQGIPSTLCEPVRFHHALALENESPLKHALLIRLADLLILYFQLGKSGNHVEISDPFLTEEWQWYLENSGHAEADGNDLKETVMEQVSRISDLVRKIIT